MKICGTVRRPPERRIMTSRSAGVSSSLTSSNATPLRLNKPRARSQKPHHDVEYITTLPGMPVIACSPAPGIATHQRQVLGPPGLETTAQARHLVEALLAQCPRGGAGSHPGFAAGEHRLVAELLQRLDALRQVGARDV